MRPALALGGPAVALMILLAVAGLVRFTP